VLERELLRTLDLWGCMWDEDERDRFETAVVRSLTDENPTSVRRVAYAACHALGTPRLSRAAAHVVYAQRLDPDELAELELSAQPYRRALVRAAGFRGDLAGVEALLSAHTRDPADVERDRLLDFIDARDLVDVARTTTSAVIFREVDRRLRARGPYQRGRVSNLLGWRGLSSAAARVVVDRRD
jgi:hypothetical protein